MDLPIRMPNPSPTLDKNLASMGPRSLSSIGVGVWRMAPEAFPDSNTTLDTFQSAKHCFFLQGNEWSRRCREINQHPTLLGNGRNTVSRILFRRREPAEFWGKLGEFCEKLGEFALAHK